MSCRIPVAVDDGRMFVVVVVVVVVVVAAGGGGGGGGNCRTGIVEEGVVDGRTAGKEGSTGIGEEVVGEY